MPVETDALKNWTKGRKFVEKPGLSWDMDNGAILYGKSMDRKYYPAILQRS